MASWLWKPCLQQLGANPRCSKSTRSSSQRSVPLVFVRNPKPNLGNRISCLSKDNDSFGNNQSDRTGLQIYRDIERSVCLLSFLEFVFSGYIYICVCVYDLILFWFLLLCFFFPSIFIWFNWSASFWWQSILNSIQYEWNFMWTEVFRCPAYSFSYFKHKFWKFCVELVLPRNLFLFVWNFRRQLLE